jgi:transposase-like protein
VGGIIMPYKEVSLDTKINVVKDYFSGMNVARIARKHNVSRDSVYTWKNAALDSMKNALQSYKTDTVNDLKNQLITLKEKYNKLSEDYSLLSQKSQFMVSSNSSDEVRPIQCPECSGNHIVKNGFYETKNGVIQRFRCKDCNKRIYIVKKNSN